MNEEEDENWIWILRKNSWQKKGAKIKYTLNPFYVISSPFPISFQFINWIKDSPSYRTSPVLKEMIRYSKWFMTFTSILLQWLPLPNGSLRNYNCNFLDPIPSMVRLNEIFTHLISRIISWMMIVDRVDGTSWLGRSSKKNSEVQYNNWNRHCELHEIKSSFSVYCNKLWEQLKQYFYFWTINY